MGCAKNKILIVLLFMIILAGCSFRPVSDISEIKKDENLGKSFTVSGITDSPFTMKDFSGYKIIDKKGQSIRIIAKKRMKKGKQATVTGTLKKNTLYGHYLDIR